MNKHKSFYKLDIGCGILLYTSMEHYVYIYLNPLKEGDCTFGKFQFDYEPFYIGISKRESRINKHISDAKRESKSIKDRTILKILESKKEPIRYKLYDKISLYSAKRLEIYLIKLIGRRNLNEGPLSNLTNGGDGEVIIGRKGKLNANYGNKWTDEQKKRASEKSKKLGYLVGDKNPMNIEEYRKKVSESKMGIKNPNGCIWELISPSNEKHIIKGGIKRELKKYELNYQQFVKCEIVDGYRYNKVKKNWKLKKL